MLVRTSDEPFLEARSKAMPIFSASEVEALLEKLRESQQTQIEALDENKRLERCPASDLPARGGSIAVRQMPLLSTACSQPGFPSFFGKPTKAEN
jgi:hypothetical protein